MVNPPSEVTPVRHMNLQQLVDLCHARSDAAGWWNDLHDMRPEHQKYLFATKIALIQSETSEMFEGLRKGKPDDHLPHRSAEEVEAADLLIRLFDYAGARGLDLAGAVEEKLAYNAQRKDHTLEHRAAEGGKKF